MLNLFHENYITLSLKDSLFISCIPSPIISPKLPLVISPRILPQVPKEEEEFKLFFNPLTHENS
jgi:hypothetical protein